ncbi:hypothetical protein QAD02_017964 [Eretmocerus hayati]|uniref:Uncharacterized protein n=1 Tax=Eretmocerus hayati TaxID=131215 RepID=A0ACC2PFD5_9HYME|nr:hypothetical protein QAD02_017964 [Eretmocerus hayati]
MEGHEAHEKDQLPITVQNASDGWNSGLQCLQAADIIDVADIVFETPARGRGRPKAPPRTAIGLLTTPKLDSYIKKNFMQKVRHTVSLIIDENSVDNVLSFSYKLKLDDVKMMNINTLSEFFVDRSADVNILEKFMEQDAFNFLSKLVSRKKKAKKLHCGVCTSVFERNESKDQCVSCLLWYHSRCVAAGEKRRTRNKEFFCEACKNDSLK